MDFTFKNSKGKLVRAKDVKFYDIYNNPEKYGLDKDIFHKKDSDGSLITAKDDKGKSVYVKKPLKDLFVQNSAMPVMISDKHWSLNDMTMQFETDGLEIHAQTKHIQEHLPFIFEEKIGNTEINLSSADSLVCLFLLTLFVRDSFCFILHSLLLSL